MKESINLLPQTPGGVESVVKITDKIAPLALGVVVFLELIFIFLLFFRAKFDKDLLVIKTSIEQKRSALSQTVEVEKIIRTVQNKLSTIREFRSDRLSFLKAINYTPTLIPEDVTLVNIALKQDLLQIVAKTGSGTSFAKMVDNVSHSAKFYDLTLTGSSFDNTDGFYTFNFEARVERGIFK